MKEANIVARKLYLLKSKTKWKTADEAVHKEILKAKKQIDG